MKTKTIILAGAAAAAATILGIAPALASTGQPHPGPFPGPHQRCSQVYNGYDGWQVNTNGFALVEQGAQIPGFSQLTGTKHPTGCGQFWFAEDGGSTKTAVITSDDGVPGNQVIAEVHHRLVVTTGTGSTDEQWNFNGYGWQNEATNDVISIGSHGQVSMVPASTGANANDTFTFKTS